MESQVVEQPVKSTPTSPVATGAPSEGYADKETEERARLDRYNEVLLTSSSILAGFAMTGLLGLPEVGKEGIARLAATLFVEPSEFAFMVVYYSMLVATICFLGVLVAVVSGRLQGKRRGLLTLRSTFRTSVLVFGIGLSALFCATVTMGIPTEIGFLVGIGGGSAISMALFVRAMVLQ